MTSSSTSSSSLVDRINALLREDASGRVVSVESLPGERERYERRLRAFRYTVTRERDAEGDCDAPSSSEAAMAIENRNQLMCARTKDFREGMSAFLEKRPPVYEDR